MKEIIAVFNIWGTEIAVTLLLSKMLSIAFLAVARGYLRDPKDCDACLSAWRPRTDAIAVRLHYRWLSTHLSGHSDVADSDIQRL